MRLHGLTIGEFLAHLAVSSVTAGPISFDLSGKIHKEKRQSGVIKILSVNPIESGALIRYLSQRNIQKFIADTCLVEVSYQIGNKNFFALGFKNDKGGYELRSPVFKGSSSPKSVTFMNANVSRVAVFEGVFDFLSFLSFRWRVLPFAIVF